LEWAHWTAPTTRPVSVTRVAANHRVTAYSNGRGSAGCNAAWTNVFAAETTALSGKKRPDICLISPDHNTIARSDPKIPTYSYRIIYRVERERVLIAAVIHGSRLLQPFVPRIEG